MISEAWILAQPEARLRFPGSHVLLADSRGEVEAVPGDPAQTSAFSRAFSRAPAGRAEIADWYDARLEKAGWRLVVAPEDHPQHYRRYRRGNEAFSLFLYDESPFKSDFHGVPGPSVFHAGETVYQVFYEARAAGFPDSG